MTMKFNLAALAILTAAFAAAPMIASADATTTGSGSTLAAPIMTAYQDGYRRHRHHHHRHRHPHAVSAATAL
jgi:ABC-type nitrate/sulfonate/bicarbonate transport system substrate-binding protein